MIQVAQFTDTPEERRAWTEFIGRSPQATLFHGLAWRDAVAATFGHKPYYLYARQDGDIEGVLPMFLIESRVFGRHLISVPFAVYGGICTNNPSVEAELFGQARQLAAKLKVDYLELKNLHPNGLDLPVRDLYWTFILELPKDPQTVWDTMRKRNRNILRKGIKSGLGLYRPADQEGIDEKEYREFYDLFARTQKALGTPVLPKRFFDEQLASMDVKIFSAVYKGEIVSSLWVIFFKDVVYPYYIGYDSRYLDIAPNNWILWEVIKYGCEHGYKYYDMGRSRYDTGPFHFKVHWGIEPHKLPYQYYLLNGAKMPNLNPSNPRFDLAKKVWSHLPLPLTKALGPSLVKYLG